jgi:hypothetical protein
MMQWNSARWGGMVRKPFDVRHVIQLLDPGNQSHVPSNRGRFGVKERRSTSRR